MAALQFNAGLAQYLKRPGITESDCTFGALSLEISTPKVKQSKAAQKKTQSLIQADSDPILAAQKPRSLFPADPKLAIRKPCPTSFQSLPLSQDKGVFASEYLFDALALDSSCHEKLAQRQKQAKKLAAKQAKLAKEQQAAAAAQAKLAKEEQEAAAAAKAESLRRLEAKIQWAVAKAIKEKNEQNIKRQVAVKEQLPPGLPAFIVPNKTGLGYGYTSRSTVSTAESLPSPRVMAESW
eukprot:TRINITY_DN12343_c0_g2_i1.p1 TRINITY_DN12343_c0_g2~~TRINITY_DN12343_c0_g2_i1.p1  ORF type:complete len:238 (+),score=76.57 TRINITY_DN12343_c0_g2_i1:74-787(+)